MAWEARQRHRPRKLEDPDLRAYVVAGLNACWSPEQWFVPGLMEAVILGKDRCHECTEKVSR